MAQGAGKVAKVVGKLTPIARAAGPVGGAVAAGAQVIETGVEIRQGQRDQKLNQAQKEQLAVKTAVKVAGKITG